MLPWENPRWIKAFVAILILDVVLVFGIVRFTEIKLLLAFACVGILTDISLLVWFFQSEFRNRKAVRDLVVVFWGGGIVLACSIILYEKSETTLAALLILIAFLSRRIWSRYLLRNVRAEIDKEKV